MRAIIYARVSGDDRGSLASQIEMGREYARNRGYTVVGEYAEEWVSGAAMDAPELQRALDQALAGAFDVLIVREMDRLARDLVKQMIIEEQLHKAGVAIEYVLGEYPDTPEGTLNKQIRAVVAEYERQKITERSVRGRRASARAGRVLGGRAPYGYRFTEDHVHLEIVEPEANVIRAIFTWYTDNDGDPQSSLQIAARLTALHVPTWGDLHTGIVKAAPVGTWNPRRVMAILHNETYAGTFYYGRANNGNLNPREQWIPVEVPAIITDTTWAAAQLQCHRNRTRPVIPTLHPYLFQGRITCGECGSAVYAVTDSHNKARPYRYYRCGDKLKGRCPCTLPGFTVESIDEPAWEWITELLLNPERLAAGLEAIRANPAWDDPTQRRYIEAQQRELAAAAQLTRLQDLYLMGHLTRDAYITRRLAIEADKQQANREQRDIETLCTQAEPPTDDDLATAAAFAAAIRDELYQTDHATRRRIVTLLDATIHLYNGRHADVTISVPRSLRDRMTEHKYISKTSYIPRYTRIHLQTTLTIGEGAS